MSSTKLLLICLLLINPFNIKTSKANTSIINEQKITLSKQIKSTINKKIHIKIKRLYNQGGEPIILSHAFMLNNLAYNKLSIDLWKKGFDVWLPNMRGHGNGSKKTTVTPYQSGDYSFDHIITEDWPILIDHITKETKKKIHIIGHSIGGMSWEQYLSGVFKEEGEIHQNDQIAKNRAQDIATYTAITTPPNFKQFSNGARNLLFTLSPVTRYTHLFIPFTLQENKKNYKTTIRNLLSNLLQPIFPYVFPSGILNFNNINKNNNELHSIIQQGLSSPHTDLLHDLTNWISHRNNYISRDNNVNYETNKKLFVPSLMIAASHDSLAPKEQISISMAHHPKEFTRKFVVFEDYSHVDILFEKNREQLIDVISTFIQEEE